MFGKLKDILGIEGVKVNLLLPPIIRRSSTSISGKVQLESLSDKIIDGISIKLIEKYARGRKDKRLIDEYTLGEKAIDGPIEIRKDEKKIIEFELDFSILKSEMDEMAESNIFSLGMVKLAKLLKNVNSSYRLEASVDVRGTKLDPTVSHVVEFK